MTARLASIALLLILCISVGTQPAGAQDFSIRFDWPPLPEFNVPKEPFLGTPEEQPLLMDLWRSVEKQKDALDPATFERLRQNVEQAKLAANACEQRARDFLRLYKPYESELRVLLEKVRDFNKRSEVISSGPPVANAAEFEQIVAPFRAEYAVLRKQWDGFIERGKRLGHQSETEVMPEAWRVSQLLNRIVDELKEVTEQLRTHPPIGATGAVSGTIRVTRPWGGNPIILHSGMAVRFGDSIRTDPDASVRLLLLDETVFAVGPDTDLVLDEFVYDASTGQGRITTTITKGAIRFISGRLPGQNPEGVKIKLPMGSVGGIRGTEFIIEVRQDGRSRIDVLEGQVEFTSDKDGSASVIIQGEGLRIGADGVVSPVATIDVEEVDRKWRKAVGAETTLGTFISLLTKHYMLGLAALLILSAAPLLRRLARRARDKQSTSAEDEGVPNYKSPRWEKDESDLDDPFPLPPECRHPGWDPDLEPVKEEPTICPVCGDLFTGRRRSRCPQCHKFVHRSCLSQVTVPGGRLCNVCCAEGVQAKTESGEMTDEEPQPTLSLHEAARAGNLAALRSYIQQEIKEGSLDINVRDPHGATPLHFAAHSGQEETAALLLDSGADVNAADSEGVTAMHLAAEKGHKGMAALLYVHGADVNPVDKNGFTPLQVAYAKDNWSVAELLEMHGGQA